MDFIYILYSILFYIYIFINKYFIFIVLLIYTSIVALIKYPVTESIFFFEWKHYFSNANSIYLVIVIHVNMF